MLQTHAPIGVDADNPFAAEVVAAILNTEAPQEQPAALEAEHLDRRTAERRLIHATGEITFSARYVPLPCMVLDICDIGARLQVENVNQVPEAFKLTVEQNDFAADCIVVWRTGSEVGVVFRSAQW